MNYVKISIKVDWKPETIFFTIKEFNKIGFKLPISYTHKNVSTPFIKCELDTPDGIS